jgi:hypothetical protein
MKAGYESADLDTTMAQRQAAEANEVATANFVSTRSLTSGSGTLTSGTRAGKPSGAALNDFYFETDTKWLYYWGGTAWLFMAGLNSGTNAVRAAITVTTNDNGAAFFTTDQNKLWRVIAGAWVDQFVTLDLTTSLKVNGTKVLGTQGALIADATGGATVDAEARTAINTLLARLRTHGIIAT